jgi:hypothetical protein
MMRINVILARASEPADERKQFISIKYFMSKRKNNTNNDDLSAFLPSLGKKTKLNDNELPSGFGKIQQVNDYDYAIEKTVKKKVSPFDLSCSLNRFRLK